MSSQLLPASHPGRQHILDKWLIVRIIPLLVQEGGGQGSVAHRVGALREAPSRKRAGLVTGAVREPPLRKRARLLPRWERVATVTAFVTVGFSFDDEPTVNSQGDFTVTTSG